MNNYSVKSAKHKINIVFIFSPLVRVLKNHNFYPWFVSSRTKFICILLLFAFASCKRQNIIKSPEPVENISVELDTTQKQNNSVEIQKEKFKYLDSKFKINYQNGKENSKAKVKLRMRKDSLIWVSITGPVGIEGFRAKILKDSVFVIDYVNKQYMVSNFDTLSKILNFKVDYKMLEAIILGNMPIELYDEKQVVQEGKYLKITQLEKEISIENYLNPQNNKLEQLYLKDSKTNSTLKLLYENFVAYNGFMFPNTSHININYFNKKSNQTENTNIDIDYSDVKISDDVLNFPFNIPEKYKKQ